MDPKDVRAKGTEGRIEMEFPWFREKTAPVTGVRSMMDYEVKLCADRTAGKQTIAATVIVPVMSLCPSSKAIADYGAHNQRSQITLTVTGQGDTPYPLPVQSAVRLLSSPWLVR